MIASLLFKTHLFAGDWYKYRFRCFSKVSESIYPKIFSPTKSSWASKKKTDGTVIEIDFEKFKKAFFTDPDVALTFFKSLSKKIKHLEDVIALNVVLDSTARLAKYLYEHSDVLNTLKNYQLAEHLHMTPETLSRTFKKLVVLELLVKDSEGYKIKNREGLRVLFE